MAVASSPRYLGVGKPLESVVDVGEYRGTLGTMWLIVREEGISSTYENAVAKTANRAVKRPGKLGERKGQGIEGLWRGWRVGFWGLVGVWGAGMLRAAGGGEF
jgi:fusion and transport protein UGO1